MNLEKLFHLKEHRTDVKTEVMAGITTFMTMAYILAVNPNILSAAGMDSKGCYVVKLFKLISLPVVMRLWETPVPIPNTTVKT